MWCRWRGCEPPGERDVRLAGAVRRRRGPRLDGTREATEPTRALLLPRPRSPHPDDEVGSGDPLWMPAGGDRPVTDRRVTHEPRDDLLAALLGPWLPARRWFPVKGTAVQVTAVGGLTLLDPDPDPDPAPDPDSDAEVRLLLLRVSGAGTRAVLQVPVVLRGAGPADTTHSADIATSASTLASASTTAAEDGPVPGVAPDTSASTNPTVPTDPAVIGHLPDGTQVLDGADQPAFVRAWLAAATRPDRLTRPDGTTGTDTDTTKTVTTGLGAPRVLPGEQSNTSVILPGAGPDGGLAMLKVFRGLSAGDNPDVDVPRALAEVGWPHVPRPLAWLSAQWPEDSDTPAPHDDHRYDHTVGRCDNDADGHPDNRPDGHPDDGTPAARAALPVAHGHLGVLTAFIPDASDGFELACDMAHRGVSFGDLATELGAVIGQMHHALAEAFPATPATDTPAAPPIGQHPAPPEPGFRPAASVVADALADRFAWASDIVPELTQHADAVAALAERTRLLSKLPPRQRVHGDLHLGQVLRGDHTWYVLDFEGEPLAPVVQRTRPDLALRDAAGMLRSFDYAAALGGAPGAWTEVARTAFLAGYSAESPQVDPGLRAHLLRVLELDKALYEVVYEARNRPAWVSIPLRAVQRLIG